SSGRFLLSITAYKPHTLFTHSSHTPPSCVRMKLLALVLLLSVFSSLTLTEVVEDFESSSCSMFFIQIPNSKHVITPTVFRGDQYKKICQRWNNKYTFATLYDRKHRIPVYSAYTFWGQNTNLRRNNDWKNEPQLENMNRPEMREITDAEIDNFFHQAVDRDYRGNNLYTRGHVFPYQYAGNQDQADSTFTFTNAAPQTKQSNGDWADQVETPMKGVIKNNCNPNRSNPAFIVTGVVPGNKWIKIMRNNRIIPKGINIPIYYWTAFCCYSNQSTRISKAYLYWQNPELKSYETSYMSVNMLNERLSSYYKIKFKFKVFGDVCLT
ncbi:hypothetical protein QTP86_025794, partial [Hemibagrus guttatus]